MKNSLFLSAFSVSVLSILASGCAAETGSSVDPTPSVEPAANISGAHMMLTDQARATLPETKVERSAKSLTYYGGPVVQNVQVHPVYWNSSVTNQSSLNSFYSAISAGQYMTFLSQYSTTSPKQTIGNGSAVAGVVDTQTGTSLTDAQVQSYLVAAFNSGKLPKPNSNTYYPIHFPSGVSIALDSADLSCVQFCAYHGTGTYNGAYFYYGVLPDLSQSGCAGGCGSSTVLNNTTSVASHEFAETVTDPAVGVASSYAAPLAWYNSTYGEIGDICNGQQTTATLNDGKSYTVQKLWSNKSSACVAP